MSRPIARRADRLVETAIDDEIVVMDIDTGDFFSLAGTARSIWQLIDGTRDQPALVAALAQSYGCAPDALTGDVARFVEELAAANLVGEA